MRSSRFVIPTLLLLAAGCSTVGQNVPGVDNFAKVDDVLYRGAQPTQAGVTDTLRQQGVRTIVNLRDDPNPAEPAWAHEAGMTYIAIPSKATKVEPAKVAEFLRNVETAPRPIFVHCRQGRDRTGLDVAAYRIVDQGWSREDALKDLYDHGYHWAVFPGIAKYVKTFDPQAIAPPKEVKQTGG